MSTTTPSGSLSPGQTVRFCDPLSGESRTGRVREVALDPHFGRRGRHRIVVAVGGGDSTRTITDAALL